MQHFIYIKTCAAHAFNKS